MASNLTIRTSQNTDADSIFEVHQLAFERDDEAKLVMTLLDDPDFINELSIVGVFHDQIVGHVLFSNVSIEDPANSTEYSAIALAPLAVLPQNHKQGVGTAITQVALQKADEMKYSCAVVLGDPNYYGRFGFQTSKPFGILSPFDVEDKHFMVKKFSNFDERIKGTVRYHKAFDGV